MKIMADSLKGRTLLALRAGPVSSAALAERFGISAPTSLLESAGLIEGDAEAWRLTDAGRAACPLRNPAASKVAPPVAGAISRRIPHASPVSAVTAPLRQAPAIYHPQREAAMDQTYQPTTFDVLRALLKQRPNGMPRKELIKHIDAKRLDCAMHTLIKRGELRRLGYGWIALVETGNTAPATAPAAPFTVLPPPLAPTANTSPADKSGEFALFDDGRLVIDINTTPLTLNPKQTRRLAHFLGCFDPSPISA